MLEKVLQSLSLGNKEIKIYKSILEHGKIAPALLSRLTGINRTTVYSVAKELKEKGLIIEDSIGRVIYYNISRDNELEKLVKVKKEEAEKKENSIRDLQELLKNVPESKTYSIPKIKFIEEHDLEDYLHEAFPKWCKSMVTTDLTGWGFQDHTLIERFEKWIDWSWKKMPKGVNLRLLTNESDIENKMVDKEYSDRRQMKFLDDKNFTATQWVVGDYVIFIMAKQKPFYLVEIHDSVIAHNSRELFKSMWGKV